MRFVAVDPNALPAIMVSALAGKQVTITVPASEPSSFALAHRIAGAAYEAIARDMVRGVLDQSHPSSITVKRGRQGFCTLVEIAIEGGNWVGLWTERAMTIVPTVARDVHGRPTHRVVYR